MPYAQFDIVFEKTCEKGLLLKNGALINTVNSFPENLKIQGVQLLKGGVLVGDMMMSIASDKLIQLGRVTDIYVCDEFNKLHPDDNNLFTMEIETEMREGADFNKNDKLMVLHE